MFHIKRLGGIIYYIMCACMICTIDIQLYFRSICGKSIGGCYEEDKIYDICYDVYVRVYSM